MKYFVFGKSGYEYYFTKELNSQEELVQYLEDMNENRALNDIITIVKGEEVSWDVETHINITID